MFDIKRFEKEIKAQLKGIPDDKQVAFAVRSAMRVLPLLAIRNNKKEPFWFWETEDKAKHLLAILKACSYCIEYALTKQSTILLAMEVAAEHVYDASHEIGINVLHALHVSSSAEYACLKYTLPSSEAAYAAAEAAGVNSDVIAQEIRNDLVKLIELSTIEFLSLPLWSSSIPADWQQIRIDFQNDAKSLNSGFEIWLWYEDRLYDNRIDIGLLQQWNNVPKEIEAQGVAVINAYLKSLIQEKGKFLEPLNRVRAIFIGYGEAGKTSLIRALHGEEVTKGTEAMTCGIEIRDWQVPNTDIQAHFWDFGGQVVFHSTHKFFLRSSCVYIIVINARADKDEDSEQVEYWLEHVKTFGGSAPVLIVRNKADEAEVHLQEQELKNKYPDMIKGFYSVSCTHATTTHKPHFEIFKEALSRELKQAVDKGQVMFTPAQGKVLEELGKNSLDDAFLSKQDFQQLCDKHSVSDDGELNRAWLVDIFDKLGVMLHFDELETYLDTYMLNPRWLTFGVYNVMNAKQARLDNKKIVEILKNAKIEDEYKHLLTYPADKCRFISDAMQRFKLCYPLPNGEILIPSLLGKELPRLDLPGFKNLEGLNDTLQFEFNFSGFLPRNLIGEFMVSRYEEIKNNLQSQRGAVFKSRSLQAEALVEADYHRRLIIMQVVGRDAKEYLTILYDAMLTVFGELNLDYREWVNLPLSACLDKETLGFNRKVEKAPYQQLLANAKKGKTDYVSESGLEYDLMKLLGMIMPDSKVRNITVNGNYIDGDVKGGNIAGRDVNIENIGEKKVSSQSITFGDNAQINGSVVAAEKIENSFNSLKESKAEDEVKQLLEQLLNEIKTLNGKVPEQTIQTLSEESESLIAETTKEQPRKKYLGLSLEGIKEAVETIGEIAAPIWAIAEKLSPLLIV